LKERINVTLKAFVDKNDPVIYIAGRGETTAQLSATGEHQRILKLKNKDKVQLIIRKVK